MSDINKTLQERGLKYGAFKDFSEISQNLKDIVYLNLNLDPKMPEINNVIVEGIDMICHKLARIANGNPYYLDSWRDLSAYAKLVCDELEITERAVDVKTINIVRTKDEWTPVEDN